MQQTRTAEAYRKVVEALRPDAAALAAEVARDVAPSGGTPDELEAARAAVDWLLDSLAAGPVPDPEALRPLRDQAAAEARARRPLQPVLDRALSAGWVLWAAATSRGAPPAAALAALGEALLRTGDAAAAAIADGHAAAEREAATRSASALRELLDEMLELGDADEAGRAHLLRRTGELAIPPDRAITVIVADAGRDLADGDPSVTAVARALAAGAAAAVGDPRALGGPLPLPVAAASRGRLVVLMPAVRRPPAPGPALGNLGPGWLAVRAEASGILDVARAAREATAGLAIARRLGRHGELVAADALLLERALLADPVLLRAAVAHELGPLEHARRGDTLVATIEGYLGERENVRATARRLSVAPRTVAYRLERIERLLGGRLDADRRLRLAAALFARRLTGPAATGDASGDAPGREGAGMGGGRARPRPAGAPPGRRVSRAAGAVRPR